MFNTKSPNVVYWPNLQVDDMVDMYEDTRSKYEAVLEHMKERICDRYIPPFMYTN